MTGKQWMLILLAAALGGLSLYLNRDWFASDNIQIYHRSRPDRSGLFRRKRPATTVDNSAINPIVFGFDRKMRLTSLKVISVKDAETNKYPQPIWCLISDSNSVPVKDFAYGVPITGMRPSVQGAIADPLVPGEKYRLLVEAGKFKAEHDFVPMPHTP